MNQHSVHSHPSLPSHQIPPSQPQTSTPPQSASTPQPTHPSAPPLATSPQNVPSHRIPPRQTQHTTPSRPQISLSPVSARPITPATTWRASLSRRWRIVWRFVRNCICFRARLRGRVSGPRGCMMMGGTMRRGRG